MQLLYNMNKKKQIKNVQIQKKSCDQQQSKRFGSFNLGDLINLKIFNTLNSPIFTTFK